MFLEVDKHGKTLVKRIIEEDTTKISHEFQNFVPHFI